MKTLVTVISSPALVVRYMCTLCGKSGASIVIYSNLRRILSIYSRSSGSSGSSRRPRFRTQKCLSIGYIKDIELAEQVARPTGAKELIIETRPEGDTLMLSTE